MTSLARCLALPSRHVAALTAPRASRIRSRTATARLIGVALALLTIGCGKDTVAPPVPASLAKVTGDAQTGTVGSALPAALSVRVLDASAKPMAGVSVTFSVTGGGGSLSAVSAVTGADGIATSGSWTLGTVPGANTATATIAGTSVTGNPAVFSATATVGVAKTLAKTAGDNSAGVVGAIASPTPSVKVSDQYGNAISGVTVTFVVASGGGSVASTTAGTAADGTASAPAWTLGTVPGSNTLTATIAGTGVTGNPATFTATTTVGAARTLTKQAGDNQSATAGAAVPIAPAVKVVDPFGNAIAGVTVTFAVTSGSGTLTGATPTTGTDGIARLGSWTLGTTNGANTITATIPGSGIVGNPATFTATATQPAFAPTANTTLGGTVSYASVTIPIGVTVTVTSDLTLSTTGAITIAGTLVGDCRAISVTAGAALTVIGTMRNTCTTAPTSDPAGMVLVGRGGYTLASGSTVAPAGDLLVTNEPTLVTPIVTPSAVVRAPIITRGARASGFGANAITYDCVASGTVTAPPARNGTDGGATGGIGGDGRKYTLSCQGNGLLQGAVVSGQNGGRGGSATSTSASAATALAGKGGIGGLLVVYVTGQLDVSAATLFGGNGGDGGTATATSTFNASRGTSAAPATATAGPGGVPGTITVRSLAGINITGQLTLNVGNAGAGGNATAVAADGANAAGPGTLAQLGGAATATAGDGGASPELSLTASGGVANLAGITVGGGQGGLGGVADATGGRGGDGVYDASNQSIKNGAAGGAITAKGGQGGESGTKNLIGAFIAPGGGSGDAFFRRGIGGNGYSDCVNPITNGGKGGAGGEAIGGALRGGLGAANGAAGVTRFVSNSNGGNGGSGIPAGTGGDAGANSTRPGGATNTTNPAFRAGTPGAGCFIQIDSVRVTADPAPSHEGFVQYGTVNALIATVDATGAISFAGPSGSKWIPVSGSYNQSTGAFSTTGTGSAAGYGGVPSTFTGTVNQASGKLTGSVTLTGNANTPPGGLPGHSVTYAVYGTVKGASTP